MTFSITVVVGFVMWVYGVWLYIVNNSEDVDGSFKMMWGARFVSLGIILTVMPPFMKDFGVDMNWFKWTIFVIDIIIFVVYAVREHKVRQIFYEQVRNMID